MDLSRHQSDYRDAFPRRFEPLWLSPLVRGPAHQACIRSGIHTSLDIALSLDSFARQTEAPAFRARGLLPGLEDRLVIHVDAGHGHAGTEDPDANDNAPTLPPPEAWCLGYGRSGRDGPPITLSPVSLNPFIEARPPALRSRCGRMV